MTDVENIEILVRAYIEKNFDATAEPRKLKTHGFTKAEELDEVDFFKLYAQAKNGCETFSEMLLRLINESGEEAVTVYTRANIDRRHFSKIAKRADYQPSKSTVMAFAIALKLDFGRTRELLSVAGFALTKSSLADVIVSFFIEHQIFDVDLVNQILHKYNQPLLGS